MSFTSNYRLKQKRGNSQGGVLKISGGGGNVMSQKKSTDYTDCVSCSNGSFQIGPKNSTGLTNVNTKAVITRKTNFRNFVVGVDGSNNVLANSSSQANYVITKNKELNINKDGPCGSNLAITNSTGNACSVKCGKFVANNVKTTNIQSSSERIEKLRKTNC